MSEAYVMNYIQNIMGYDISQITVVYPIDKLFKDCLKNKVYKAFKKSKSLYFEYKNSNICDKIGSHRVVVEYKPYEYFKSYQESLSEENKENAEMLLEDSFLDMVIIEVEDDLNKAIEQAIQTIINGTTSGIELDVLLPEDYTENPFKYVYEYILNDLIVVELCVVDGLFKTIVCVPYQFKFVEIKNE